MNRLLGWLKDLIVLGLGAVAVLYLIYPSLGIFELIPDATPLIGSLDEIAAAALLLNCLRYFGVDLTRFFSRAPRSPAPGENADETK